MSTIITRATLEGTLPYFLVQVLRVGLVDSHTPVREDKDWVFKSHPTDDIEPDDLPRVTLDLDPVSYDNWNIDGTKYDVDTISLEGWVMCGGANVNAGALGDRDTYVDSVRGILMNPESVDGDGLSVRGNHIVVRSFSSGPADFYPSGHPKLVRAKKFRVEVKYFGN